MAGGFCVRTSTLSGAQRQVLDPVSVSCAFADARTHAASHRTKPLGLRGEGSGVATAAVRGPFLVEMKGPSLRQEVLSTSLFSQQENQEAFTSAAPAELIRV